MSNIKSVKINNILGGQGQNFFDPANPNKINTGSKITLKPKSGYLTIADDVTYADQTTGTPSSQIVKWTDGYFYKLVVKTTGGAVGLLRSLNGQTWTLVYSFAKGAGSNYVYALFIVGTQMVAIIDAGNSAHDEVYYSTNPTSSWTYSTYLESGFTTFSVVKADTVTYLLTSGGDLFSTTDGISFSTVLTGIGRVVDAEWLDGFLYFVQSSSDLTRSELFKFSPISNTYKAVKSFKAKYPMSLVRLNDKLVITLVNLQGLCEVYFYNDEDCLLLAQISGISSVNGAPYNFKAIYANNEKAFCIAVVSENQPNGYPYTVDSIGRYLICVYNNGAVVREQDFGTGADVTQIYEYGENILFDCNYWSSGGSGLKNRIFQKASDFYYASVYFTLPEIEIGKHVPIGLLVRHGGNLSSEIDGLTVLSPNILVQTYFEYDTEEFDLAKLNFQRANKLFSDPSESCDRAISYRETQCHFTKDVDRIFSFIFFSITLKSDYDLQTCPLIYSLEYFYLPVGLTQQ